VSLVVASQIRLARGDRVVLGGASFSIGPHERIGLVGPNGSGKTSLLRILSGAVAPDSGTLTWRRGARAGYLPQEVVALDPGPLAEVVLASVPGRAALEERLAATEAALASAREEADQIELSEWLAALHEELDHFEEHYGRRRAERILSGLGFGPEDLARDVATLSGGWRMRAALAGLLLQDPDLLLLDEPTNHLDVPTLEWFDAFLTASRKALVLVTHDREFLNRQIGRVLALEPEGLRSQEGDYDAYRTWRAAEADRLSSRARRQQARRAELTGFIERFGAKASKAAQARSKQKMLDRMEEVAEHEARATLRFRFAEAPRSGREVLRFEGVSRAFGSTAVYRGLDATVLRGERIGVIGPNGAGKSTLLRLAAGVLPPDAGAVRLGHGVVAGYYAQHLFERPEHGAGELRASGALDPGRTVLDTLWAMVPDRGEAFVRGVAGAFLFSGDDVEKPVGVLSGGERARVALARLLLVPANLLLLDEPTNHLDLESSEALVAALREYRGTLLFVSHNRSFVNGLATATWEVKGGGILPCPGNLDDWWYHQRQLGLAGPPAEGAGAPAAGAAGRAGERDRRRAEAEARNARYRLEKPLRDEIAGLEARIESLEREERETAAALADPGLYADFGRARPLIDRQRAAREELARLYARWDEAQERLAALGGPA
jgi:ATP-binding cassette subfamily F protein 3